MAVRKPGYHPPRPAPTASPEEIDAREDVDPELMRRHWVAPWRHTVAGMHIGDMEVRPMAGEFASVLTVAAEPGKVDDDIRHRHIPLSYMTMDEAALEEAVTWAFTQQQAERKLLVRSETGLQRPSLIVALVCLRMGASQAEALYCARRGAPSALTDFRYYELFKKAALDGRA